MKTRRRFFKLAAGATLFTIVLPIQRALAVTGDVGKVLHQGNTVDLVFRVINPDGSQETHHAKATPLLDPVTGLATFRLVDPLYFVTEDTSKLSVERATAGMDGTVLPSLSVELLPTPAEALDGPNWSCLIGSNMCLNKFKAVPEKPRAHGYELDLWMRKENT